MTDSCLMRYIIQKNGDTVEGLAADMGLSRPSLSAKINGKREFKQSEMIFIARRYKFSHEMAISVFSGGEKLCG